jgi:putative ABC transport system permease protein
MRVPLAWLNLIHDKRRFAVALAGVCFAVVLIFMEYGFWNALFDSSVAVIRQLDADLILTSKSRFSLVASQQFPRRRLFQAQAVEGVQSAHPFYIEYNLSEWKNPDAKPPDNASAHPIRVLAFDPDNPVFRLPEVAAFREQLKRPNTVLVDAESRNEYGRLTPGTERELAGRIVRVVGTFHLGTDFTTNGNVIMSDVNFARFFPDRDAPPGREGVPLPGSPQRNSSLAEVDLGVLKLAPGADLARVRADVRARLPDDVDVFTVAELVRQEMDFWETVSPIGFVFGLGMVMGFIIGAVVCYQILSTEIGDHLAEYATLKAIGYRHRILTRVILQEALMLSVLGFLPGVVLSWVLYALLAGWTGLLMQLTLGRGCLILGLTILMCMLSGLIAVRKVQLADPAEVFG